jgi:hypothetical protein
MFRHARRALVLLASVLSFVPAATADELKGTWSILASDQPGIGRRAASRSMNPTGR